jgi:hypothetical protein
MRLFSQNMNGGFQWQGQLAAAVTSTAINPFLHLMVASAHMYSISHHAQQKQQQPPPRAEEKNNDGGSFSSILYKDPATMIFELASILMMDRTRPLTSEEAHEGTCSDSTLPEERADMKLVAIPHLVCILCMLIMLVSLVVLLSFPAYRRKVPGTRDCSVRRLVLNTFGVPFFAMLAAFSSALWFCCIMVSELLQDYRLAVCISMHSSMLVMGWAMDVLNSLSAPAFMPLQLAGGTAASAGLLLFITGHMYHEVGFSTEQFYRGHALAVFLVCPVLRQTVLRLIVLLCLQ